MREDGPQREGDTTREQPIYWFALLEGAIERGDLAAAAQAQAELERLGYRVRPTAGTKSSRAVVGVHQ